MKYFVFTIILFQGSMITYSQTMSLDIDGAIRIQHTDTETPAAGTIRFNQAISDFEGWNGFFWASLTGNRINTGNVTDIDSNTYLTISIAGQVWMAENLRVSHYRNGDPIPLVEEDSLWANTNQGAWSLYDTTGQNYAAYSMEKFGHLYNWHAVNDGRGLCPEGWHVATNLDFGHIIDEFFGNNIAGAHLKETGLVHWLAAIPFATNKSGFTALPGGMRSTLVGSGFVGQEANFWSSKMANIEQGVRYRLFDDNASIHEGNSKMGNGLSVRCVKD